MSILGLKLIHASKSSYWHLGCCVLYMCHQKNRHSLLFPVTTWLCDNEILLQKLTVGIKVPLKWAAVWHIWLLCWHFVVNYSSNISCSWLVILITASKSTSSHYLWDQLWILTECYLKLNWNSLRGIKLRLLPHCVSVVCWFCFCHLVMGTW